jgi:hypothetical protein
LCNTTSAQKDTIIWLDQSSNTFFVIPPVNGCDGIWAIEDPFQNCIMDVFLIDPCWTFNSSHVSGDTLFLTLCSIPCNFVMACTDGNMVSARTGTPVHTSVDVISESKVDTYELSDGNYLYSGSNLSILLKSESEIIITNSQGKVIGTKKGTGLIRINDIELSSGLYFVTIITANAKFTEKVIVE